MAAKRVASGNSSKGKNKKLENSGLLKQNQSSLRGNNSVFKPKAPESFLIKPSEHLTVEDRHHTFCSSSNPSKHSDNKGKQSQSVTPIQISDKIGITPQKKELSDNIEKKKTFNKKEYRFKKYSKKYKLLQWEEKRKKTLLREYHRSLKNEKNQILDVSEIYDKYSDDPSIETSRHEENKDNINVDNESVEPQKKKKKPFLKPHERYQQIREEKQKKMEEMMRKKAEREEAINKARKERFERNKKLSRKTKKGQPIMKYRIEMLLDKIEKSLKQ